MNEMYRNTPIRNNNKKTRYMCDFRCVVHCIVVDVRLSAEGLSAVFVGGWSIELQHPVAYRQRLSGNDNALETMNE